MKNDSVCLEHWLASVEKNSVGEELHAPTGQLLVSIGVNIGEIHGNPIPIPIETVWSHVDLLGISRVGELVVLTSESRFRSPGGSEGGQCNCLVYTAFGYARMGRPRHCEQGRS